MGGGYHIRAGLQIAPAHFLQALAGQVANCVLRAKLAQDPEHIRGYGSVLLGQGLDQGPQHIRTVSPPHEVADLIEEFVQHESPFFYPDLL